ncbi:hypothetical protein C0J52_05848 [Blattella germanica]|nr:hypothetical protein C0J52_05848 [Blattella germanica]
MNSALACCMLLYSGMCMGLPCATLQNITLNLSVMGLNNSVGRWIARIELEHDKEAVVNTKEEAGKILNRTDEGVIHVTPKTYSIVTENAENTQIKSKKAIGSGYEKLHRVGYYKVYSLGDVNTWQKAKKRCEDDGAHLLVINSFAEATGVDSLLSKYSFSDVWVWIGFNDQYKVGNYVTIFNQTLDEAGYDSWAPGQPEKGAPCGLMMSEKGLGVGSCSVNRRPFICEIELE